MGKVALGVCILLSSACTSHVRDCSTLTACDTGGYKFCQQSSTCYYLLTDGTTIMCADCSNCSSAVQAVQNWCENNSQNNSPPDLSGPSGPPDLASSPPFTITKTGPAYTGSHTNPLLDSESDCPDSTLEPDDNGATALLFTPTPDTPTAKIVKQAICPTGKSPFTGKHDEDWYTLNNSTGPAQLYMTSQIFYDITMGDLDLAIVDSAGNLLSADGTAVTNGCVSAVIKSGVYYTIVVGANDTDVNSYDILIQTFSTPHACP